LSVQSDIFLGTHLHIVVLSYILDIDIFML